MTLTISRARRYEKKIKDHNFGSLIRTDARDEYAEKNTIFGSFEFIHVGLTDTNVHLQVTRIQVLAQYILDGSLYTNYFCPSSVPSSPLWAGVLCPLR